ncbi:alpha/beta hydrolase [Stenotrophomonas sp. 24(2023)]|uniref:alpha/beta fold hydrolase n=1 Tax=Stenotrophomonas sp. 24(2023) TaxID=3068324 RepID=UPI0027E038C0|nr:alpha/beta hydrolase [Stenotrophomonas sp. 24(2023)]WMJ68643.1 alpha/beta hydrolase [Stenotrophomonas sp. 24(2023)]
MKPLVPSLLAAALALTAGTTAMAADTPATDAATPTIVLVHGAFADGSSWSKVIPLLQAKGLRTVAVQNPLTSLEDDVAAVQRAVRAQPGPVILVGHSWAGSVITQAGNDAKVASLVYVASFAPSAGESSIDGLKAFPAPEGQKHLDADADGFLTMSPAAIARYFAQDVSAAEARLIAATQGPVKGAAFEQTLTTAAWTQKPSWYIVAGKDQMIAPAGQRALAKKIGAHTVELPTSHVPMLSSPQAVARVIEEAAHAAPH